MDLLNPYVGGSTGGLGGGGGGGGPVASVRAPGNPLTGVKRPSGGNPVAVPRSLPASRGRDVEPGGAVKVPKLRNGNKNNEMTNVCVPYNRVTPLEMLSGFCGRLSPGDCIFVDKFPPGFVNGANRAAHLNNATLGVNTLSRVVGIDGLNRLLISAKPSGYVIGENLLAVSKDQKVHDAIFDKTTGEFTLKTLARFRLDGIVKSNDEPGAFTSSGTRDAAIFNIALQGPTLVNNGYLYYDDGSQNKHSGEKGRLNNATGVPDTRTVESFARGSTEAGFHVGGVGPPGRTGSPWLGASGYDFVAQFTGTYSMYPAQQFDRGVRSLDTLYVGLVAVKLDEDAAKEVPGYVEGNCYFFFQYMPFSSRAAHLVQMVAGLTDAGKPRADAEAEITRKYVAHTKGTSRHRFDQNPFDAVRTDDLRAMVGAWHVGRVLDCKAMRYDSYAGGPADTAYALMVDVGVAWRNSRRMDEGLTDTEKAARAAAKAAAYKAMSGTERNAEDRVRVTPEAASRMLRPPLSEVIGSEMGSYTVNSCDQWKLNKASGSSDGMRIESGSSPDGVPPPPGGVPPPPPEAPAEPAAPPPPSEAPSAPPPALAPDESGADVFELAPEIEDEEEDEVERAATTIPPLSEAGRQPDDPANVGLTGPTFEAPVPGVASVSSKRAVSPARKKSPARTGRAAAATTGASVAAAATAAATKAAPKAVAAPTMAVPPGAAMASSTPLVPSAGPSAAARPRAVGAAAPGGESVDDMFYRLMPGGKSSSSSNGSSSSSNTPAAATTSASAAGAMAEPPPAASPTPSNDSDTPGPRVFRRPR